MSASVGDEESIGIPPEILANSLLRPREIYNDLWRAFCTYYKMGDILTSRAYRYIGLTNQRIIVLDDGPNTHLMYSIALESIDGFKPIHMWRANVAPWKAKITGLGVHVNAPQGPSLLEIGDITKAMEISPNDAKLAIENVKEILSQLNQKRLNDLQNEKDRERIHYHLDFSFLKMEMERGGMVINTVRCPSCGGAIQLPSEGDRTICSYCGSQVIAQDIFEKMKGLIGAF